MTTGEIDASTTDWGTEGGTTCMFQGYCPTSRGLIIVDMSIYGNIDGVTIAPLGCQIFFLSDGVRGRLKGVALELYD